VEIGSKLLEKLKNEVIFSFKLFNYDIDVYNSVVVMWIVMAVLIIFSILVSKKLETIPKGIQNVIEIFGSLIYDDDWDNTMEKCK